MKIVSGVVLLVIGVLMGIVSTQLYSAVEYPLGSAPERISPQDHVPENDIQVFSDRVVINIDDAYWATFADTNSMDPVFDKGANAIQVIPKNPSEVEVGDIVSYRRGDKIIIHRVIERGIDAQGYYWIVKGDNNPEPDAVVLRFEDITRVVVAIVY